MPSRRCLSSSRVPGEIAASTVGFSRKPTSSRSLGLKATPQLAGRRVTFSGAVRVHQLPKTGSEPRLQSEEMELRFSTNSPPRVERLEARQNVIFEQGLPGVTNGAAIYRRMTARTIVAATDSATTTASGSADKNQSEHHHQELDRAWCFLAPSSVLGL